MKVLLALFLLVLLSSGVSALVPVKGSIPIINSHFNYLWDGSIIEETHISGNWLDTNINQIHISSLANESFNPLTLLKNISTDNVNNINRIDPTLSVLGVTVFKANVVVSDKAISVYRNSLSVWLPFHEIK
jgi:hypothetical protein